GLVIGGVVTDWIGWEWIFLINVPITAVALLLAPVLLQGCRDAAASRRLDLPGAVTATAGLVLLVYGLTRSEEAGFRETAGALVLGLAFLGIFLFIQRRVEDPLVPFKIFRSRSLVGANLAAFANTATTSSVGVLVTIYLQDVRRYSPTSAGFAGLPFSLLVVVGSFLGSRMADRIGTRYTMAAGLAGISISTLLVTGISADRGLGLVLANAALTGVCLGCSAVASTAAGTSAARADEQGLVSGLLNTAAQIGTAMGLAALFTIAAARTDALSGGAKPTDEALVAGYHWAFYAGAGVAALGVVCALLLVREKSI
ncbi:MAG TPA: MFS transporter, partial [Rubrobacteraceae bacterium]|nr:MFS transporter [Rubrobacteraceae bacterium]